MDDDDEGNERELKISTFGERTPRVDAGCKGDHTAFSCEGVATLHFERHVGTEKLGEKLQLLYVS